MTSLGDITVGFRADTSSLMSGFAALKSGIGGIPALVAIGVGAFVGLGAKSAQMAGDFQVQMTKLYTTAGETKANLQMVGEGMLSMAGQVGIGAKDLADGMYWVESAGFHGAAGLAVLRIAAQGAKAENSDLIPVAHALTGVLNTYASTGITASQAMNVLIGSVGQGATTLNDMSSAISNVLPAASKFHLSLIDVTTGIATMTNQNDNAASAATHLRQVILALESPAKAGAKALSEIGLSSQQVSDAMKTSLPGAIQMIITDLGKRFPEGSADYNNALKSIAGGNKQLLGLLELSGTSLDKWKQSVAAVSGDVKAGGNSVMGWADVQQNFNFKMDQAKAIVESFMIRLGTGLLPVLTKIATFFVSNVVPALQLFGGWIQANVMPVLLKFGQWFQANAMPALQQFAAIIQNNVVPVIQNLVTIIGDALGWIKDHWTQIWGVLGPILRAVWDIVTGIIKIGWSIISGIFNVALDLIQGKWGKVWTDIKNMLGGIFDGIGSMTHGFVEGIGAAFNWLGTLLHGIWDGIVGIIKGAINLIIGLIDDFIGGIDSIGIDIGPVHVHPNIGKIPFLAGGGVVGPGQSFIAGERGAELITAGTNGASVAPLTQTGGGTHITEIYLDGLKIAQVVAPHMDALVRAKFGPRSRL